jgi:hypothetical protein
MTDLPGGGEGPVAASISKGAADLPINLKTLAEALDAVGDVIRARDAKIAALERRIVELESRGELRYCGAYEEGREYLAGNFVTRGGSLWHAEQPTRSRPGTDHRSWRLVVKKGSHDARD